MIIRSLNYRINVEQIDFGPFTLLMLIGKHAVKLDFPSHMNTYLVIHITHIVPLAGQLEYIGPAMTEKIVLSRNIEGEEHVVDKILSHWEREKRFQFFTLMKDYFYHKAVWQFTKHSVNRKETVTKVWQT